MMRVKCYPPKKPIPANFDVFVWEVTVPFCVNPRGILIHRVKSGLTHRREGNDTHHSVHYWCGNVHVISLDNVALELVETPPKDRLLCQWCEIKAKAAMEKSADRLAGRHVHVGVLKAHRTCCQPEN